MHVLLFDIDGTLLSTGGAGRAALEATLSSEFGAAANGRGLELTGRTDRAIVGDMFRQHGIENSARNWERFIRGYLKLLGPNLRRFDGRVLPGVAELLASLGGRGDVALGLLTGNIAGGAWAKLEHYEVAHHFHFGAFGDERLDRDQIARDALTAARKHVGDPLPPERVWVVGDTPLDVRCARSIGAHSLAVATGVKSAEDLAAAGPDLLLADLSDPRPVLERLP